MIKRIVLILLVISLSFAVTADDMDMVVLLDVSSSMFPYFDDAVNYLLTDIVDGHLNLGDRFHLISFNSVPEREIDRRINTEEDIEAVLARIMLLHPLGRYTDLVFALNYLYDYVSGLSRPSEKNILILTDGIHDPPPGTRFPAQTEQNRQNNIEAALSISNEMKRKGWNIRLIEFPMPEQEVGGDTGGSDSAGAVSGPNNLFDSLSEGLGVEIIKYDENDESLSHTATGAPSLEFPGHLGKVDSTFTAPFTVKNYRNDAIIIKLEKVLTRDTNILQEPVQLKVDKNDTGTLNAKLALDNYEPGEYRLDIELVFSDRLRIFPRTGFLEFELHESAGFEFFKLPLLIILITAAVVLLIFFTIVPLRRHLESTADADSRSANIALTRKHENEEERDSTDSTIPKPDYKTSLADSGGPPAASGSKVPLMQISQYKGGGKIPLSQISSGRFTTSSAEEHAPLGHRPIEFRLSGQNPFNSGRNIRWIGKNRRSVGGGNSYFLIFLVKVPEHIAEVTFTEKGLTFTPLKPEYFPALDGPVDNCINRPVTLSTDHGDFTMIFREWISPLERINHVLHLTDNPGIIPEEY